jgi:hypothetical protein
MVLNFADHYWIIDRPEARRAMWSRLNWEPSAFGKAFQIPGTTPVGDVNTLTIDQNGAPPTRTMRQVTLAAGSTTTVPPIFVTAVPLQDNNSDFAEVTCTSATCMSQTTSSGEDLVIVPYWGQTFDDDGQFFGTNLSTGRVVLAHRDSASAPWSYRLVGEEGPRTPEYTVVTTPVTWLQARDACAAQGTHLVTIDNQIENDAVRALVSNQRHVWIGLSRQASGWAWVDGTQRSYTNWGSGEPNNVGGIEQYVEMLPNAQGRWNDLPATWTAAYVCERD